LTKSGAEITEKREKGNIVNGKGNPYLITFFRYVTSGGTTPTPLRLAPLSMTLQNAILSHCMGKELACAPDVLDKEKRGLIA